ncbi:MAG: hypothetical protein NTV94_11980 [Planctomycetota bacterium]|nr:hypothetical protein [Planctomycetota bacterium]
MIRSYQLPQGFQAAACATVILSMCAGSAAIAAYDVSVRFQVEAMSFSGIPNSPYLTFPFLEVRGFTDQSNPDNRAQLISGGGAFIGLVNGPYSASSNMHANVDLLKSNLDQSPWTLSITDGANAQTRAFNITVSCAQLTGEYMRPITMLGGIDNGSAIAADQIFEWSIDDTTNPLAQYEGAYISMYAPSTGQSYSSPLITPADRSWMPDTGPLAPGTYGLVVMMYSNSVPQDLVVASAAASDGGEELTSFTTRVSAVTQMQLTGLSVVPGPASFSLFILGGLVAFRRRR